MTVPTAAPGASCEIRKGHHGISWCENRLVSSRAASSTLPMSDRWAVSILADHINIQKDCGKERGPQLVEQFGSFLDMQASPAFSNSRPCFTKIMQHQHLYRLEDGFVKAIKHTNTALTFSMRAISCVLTHPVMSPCAERGRHHQLLSLWGAGNRAVACWENSWSIKACGRLQLIFHDMRKGVLYSKTERVQGNSTARIQDWPIPETTDFSCWVHLSVHLTLYSLYNISLNIVVL